jgi:hypothetical protein
MASKGEKVATAVRIPRITTEPTESDVAIRLVLRAETILFTIALSMSRANTRLGALANEGPVLELLPGLF